MNEAFMLLAVGMITVFTILLLIVVFGNILIALVNRFIPEVEMIRTVKNQGSASMDPRKVAAIVSAVDIVSDGRAKVTSITKSE